MNSTSGDEIKARRGSREDVTRLTASYVSQINKKAPQAVFKVISHSRGARVFNVLNYIERGDKPMEQQLEAENQDGEKFVGKDEMHLVYEDWRTDFERAAPAPRKPKPKHLTKKEPHHAKAKLSRIPPPHRRDRLHHLSELTVVHNRQGRALLLPGDVPGRVSDSRPDSGVRGVADRERGRVAIEPAPLSHAKAGLDIKEIELKAEAWIGHLNNPPPDYHPKDAIEAKDWALRGLLATHSDRDEDEDARVLLRILNSQADVMIRSDQGDAEDHGLIIKRNANYIDVVEVPEDLRGAGVGSMIARNLEADIRKEGYKTAFLLAKPDSVRFWQKHGYTISSKRVDDGENIPMSKSLVAPVELVSINSDPKSSPPIAADRTSKPRGERKPRHATHAILSADCENTPVNARKVMAAAREVFQEQLASEGYRYMMVLHTDTKNPHVHIVINNYNTDPDKTKLRLNPPDLFVIRQRFAERMTELGLEQQATHRLDRPEVLERISRGIEDLQKSGSWYEQKLFVAAKENSTTPGTDLTDIKPTEKMLELAGEVAKKNGLDMPNENFREVREFLDKHSKKRLGFDNNYISDKPERLRPFDAFAKRIAMSKAVARLKDQVKQTTLPFSKERSERMKALRAISQELIKPDAPDMRALVNTLVLKLGKDTEKVQKQLDALQNPAPDAAKPLSYTRQLERKRAVEKIVERRLKAVEKQRQAINTDPRITNADRRAIMEVMKMHQQNLEKVAGRDRGRER